MATSFYDRLKNYSAIEWIIINVIKWQLHDTNERGIFTWTGPAAA